MKDVIVQLVETTFHHGDLAAMETFVAPDYVRHDPGVPFEVRGPEGFRQLVAAYRAAFPDFHLDLLAATESGDYVGTYWHATGTQRGEFMGAPPSGRTFDVTALETFRFADGKIAEHWVVVDTALLLQQLGLAG
jgi:steroid delta-isomerase-like uncharacterized protein